MGTIATAKVKSLPEPWAGEIISHKHQFITDKPESFGGQDKGPAPYDFICSGLISCTMITLRMYAQHKGFDLGEFTVEADFKANFYLYIRGLRPACRHLHSTANAQSRVYSWL